jgi:hypothetical protein
MSAGGSAPPGDPRALQAEIERTRGELGDTVEALFAKADVKARARAKAAETKHRLLAAVQPARQRVTDQKARASAMFRENTPDPMQEAAKRAAQATRRHGVPVAVAGLATVLAGWLIVRRRHR